MHDSRHQIDLTELAKLIGSSPPDCMLTDARKFGTSGVSKFFENLTKNPDRPTGLILHPGQLTCEADMNTVAKLGVKLIMWQTSPDQTDTIEKSMWCANRAGIWNHLIMPPREKNVTDRLLMSALKNPNISNSWSFSEQKITTSTGGLQKKIAALSPYANVKPLPGKPLWSTLSDPIQLLQFLHTFGLDTVQRWRLMDNNSRVEQLGRSTQFFYAKPDNLPPGYLEEICRMVEAGGSVDMDRVKFNMERAFLIAYATEFDVIIGNSSLKHPRKEYIQSLFQNTGLDLSGYLERGYTSVRPEYRGLGVGTKLLEGLTKRTGGRNLYSIITEDNLATQKIAIRNKTRKVTTFYSRKTGKEVGVWVGNK